MKTRPLILLTLLLFTALICWLSTPTAPTARIRIVRRDGVILSSHDVKLAHATYNPYYHTENYFAKITLPGSERK